MNFSIRSILILSILAIVLAACSTTIGAPASPSASPTAEPTAEPTVEPTAEPTAQPTVEPTAAPSEAPATGKREVAGTITVAEMAFSGPGGTIQQALAAGPSGDLPTLVYGVLFRDTDGTVYLATTISDATAPTFEAAPLLEVLNTPNDGPGWDMANAEMLGLQEANGIVFKPQAQVLGFLELP